MNTKARLLLMLIGLSLATLSIITSELGCFPVEKKIEAAGGYEAQQLACVDANPDRPTIDACRAKVRAAWSTKDAGMTDAKGDSK